MGNNPTRNYIIEVESYNLAVVSLLKSLAYAYIELRHFTEAIECIDEGLEYNNENPDLYFRRAQALLYNKKSNNNNLELAFIDIQKAIQFKTSKNSMIYEEHMEIIQKRIEIKKKKELFKILGIYSCKDLLIYRFNKKKYFQL